MSSLVNSRLCLLIGNTSGLHLDCTNRFF